MSVSVDARIDRPQTVDFLANDLANAILCKHRLPHRQRDHRLMLAVQRGTNSAACMTYAACRRASYTPTDTRAHASALQIATATRIGIQQKIAVKMP